MLHLEILEAMKKDYQDRHKSETIVAVEKDIPHTRAELPPLHSIETTGVCILGANNEMLLAAAYRSTQRLWNDTDITELLVFPSQKLHSSSSMHDVAKP
jgi:hypothetical protein